MTTNRTHSKYVIRRLILLALAVTLAMGMSAGPAFAGTSGGSILSKIFAKSSKPVVKKVDYDREDREVEFEFKGSVQWKNPKVKITRNGTNYVKKIKDKDSKEIEVKVKKLTYGAIYSYKITGVKNKGGGSYQTVTGTFRAVDD